MNRTGMGLIAATIVVIPILASAQAHTKSPQTKAERWARSIATIIADPHLFQSTPESLAAKFKPIVPNITTNWLVHLAIWLRAELETMKLSGSDHGNA